MEDATRWQVDLSHGIDAAKGGSVAPTPLKLVSKGQAPEQVRLPALLLVASTVVCVIACVPT